MLTLDPLIVFGALIIIAFFISEFSHKLRIVAVPMLIIAGIVIGPYGLGIIHKSEGIDFLGELGFLYLVFLAGLEIKGTKRINKKDLGYLVGVFSGISFFIGFGIVYASGYSPPDYSIATPLLIGTVFQSSSVGQIVPLINQTRRLKEKMSELLIPGVVFMDTLSLIGLSIILKYYKAGNPLELVVFIVSLIAFIYLGSRYIPSLGRWVFNRYRSSFDEMEVAFFMAVLFGMIAFSEIIGLEPVVAAFLTGLFLGECMESEIIYAKLKSIGHGFLIPLFFIMVGMDTNITLFLSGSKYLVLVITIIGGLVFSKLISGYIYSHITHKKEPLIGVVFFPQLGATLVAAKIGQNYGLVDEPLFTSIVIMAIVTALATPVIVKLIFGKSPATEMKNHTVILGGGVVGEYAAAALYLLKKDFIIVEKDKVRCEYLKNKGYTCILGDATDADVLKNVGINSARCVLVLLPDSKSSVIAAREVRNLNPKCKILARVHSEKERKILEKYADEILFPEVITGMNVIWHIMNLVNYTSDDSSNND